MPSRECYRLKRFLIRGVARRHVVILFLCLFILWFTMFCFFWDGPTLLQTADNEPYAVNQGVDARAFLSRLARQQRNVVDGPYTGRMTGYETKKLLAVLLDSLMSRVSSAQREASRLTNQTSGCDDGGEDGCDDEMSGQGNISKDRKVEMADLILGLQDRCALDPAKLVAFPECQDKVKWMQKFWTSHSCYRALGVDGSACSILIYLSEVESFCPRLPSRASIGRPNASTAPLVPRSDLAPLLNSVLVEFDPRRRTLDFVRDRIGRLWSHWVGAAAQHHQREPRRPHRPPEAGAGRPYRLRIHLHMGLLSRVVNWRIAEGSAQGGPLGELVQWSDLIASLYAMGHDLRITTEVEQLASMAAANPLLKSPCLAPNHVDLPDLIFTDIVGLRQFESKFREGYVRIKCLMRVLDTFGTQPKFNLPSYARKHHHTSSWGGWALHTAQFFNLYPLTPDNSFLGFVVERPKPAPSMLPKASGGHRVLALVYGKKAYMWKGMRPYLDILNDYFDIHATVSDATPGLVPNYVTNHLFLEPKRYQQLLSKARIFIGLGFPFEGPAPLEAISHGAVFLNPRFDPPLNRLRSTFFRSKPTDREITSQHPYIEQFIGEPFSYLVDMKDFNNVREVVWKVLSSPLPPVGMVPFELSEEGMLQRIAFYLRTQDFCGYDRMAHYGAAERWSSWRSRRRRPPAGIIPGPKLWPPPQALQFFLGVPGESCERTCRHRGRICAPSYFPVLNSVSSLHELGGVECDQVAYAENHLAPYRQPHTRACIFQSENLLFSCAGEQPGVQRLCPCRDYRRGQTALCMDCVS